jgi:hypothetical protein
MLHLISTFVFHISYSITILTISYFRQPLSDPWRDIYENESGKVRYDNTILHSGDICRQCRLHI